MDIFKQYEHEINYYYSNNAKQLRCVVDIVLAPYTITDKEEYYSLATDIFIKALISYDPNKSRFNSHLIACLKKKFYSEFRDRHRLKRKLSYGEYLSSIEGLQEVSGGIIFTPIAEYSSHTGSRIDYISTPTQQYLKSLSKQQRQICLMLMEGYNGSTICSRLNISKTRFNKIIKEITQFERANILYQLK